MVVPHEARLPPQRRPGIYSSAILALVNFAAGVAVVGAIRTGANGDSAWILHAAQRMLSGERLYIDLIEMNPPLVFWAHLPVAWLAEVLGWAPWTALVAAVLATCALAGALLNAIMRRAGLTARARIALAAAFSLTALVLPVGWFAQREHLMLVMTWPLLVLTMARLDGRAVPFWIAAVAGTLAGLGLALKPHALVVWLALLALVLARGRSLRSLALPEHLVTAAVLAVYAGAVLVLAPSFLPAMQRLAPLYLEFVPRSLTSILFDGFQAFSVWAALLLWLSGGRRVLQEPVQRVLAVAAAAFLATAAVQGKGFGYHYYPAFGCALALLVVIAVGPIGSSVLRRAGASVVLILLGVLFVPVLVSRAAGEPQRRDDERVALAAVTRATVPADGAIMVLSPRLGDAFPLVNETGVRFALRYPHLWWMAAMERLRSEAPDRAAAFEPLEAELRRSVADDISDGRPQMIIARNPDHVDRYAGDVTVDPVRYLLTDTMFARVMTDYHPAGRVAGFDLYLRASIRP